MTTQRIDRWLYHARFFKTRGLATEAVKGGKVHVGGERAKPSRTVKPGDRLEITKGRVRFEVEVEALAQRRGPASEAETLYVETAASREQRAKAAEERRVTRAANPAPAKRPDKRARRHIIRFTGKG